MPRVGIARLNLILALVHIYNDGGPKKAQPFRLGNFKKKHFRSSGAALRRDPPYPRIFITWHNSGTINPLPQQEKNISRGCHKFCLYNRYTPQHRQQIHGIYWELLLPLFWRVWHTQVLGKKATMLATNHHHPFMVKRKEKEQINHEHLTIRILGYNRLGRLDLTLNVTGNAQD
jgi:hypothetical protein